LQWKGDLIFPDCLRTLVDLAADLNTDEAAPLRGEVILSNVAGGCPVYPGGGTTGTVERKWGRAAVRRREYSPPGPPAMVEQERAHTPPIWYTP